MHFLGLAGMPRRIPDYPDAYAQFNELASNGSALTMVSIALFFIVLVTAFEEKLELHNNFYWGLKPVGLKKKKIN
jgi:cytochrome c oxidase subunit 1